MTIEEHFAAASPEKQPVLIALHQLLLENDRSVIAVIKPLMGKPAVLYEQACYMKYGLVAAKNYVSLHCLPIYMDKGLHQKYKDLFVSADVQKGCINFKDDEALPLDTINALIKECAAIDIAQVLESRKKKTK